MTHGRWPRLLPIVLFIALALASIGPIRNYDLFWHLATGRWIAEHGALPLTDPFAVASDLSPWINGEWLFDVALYGLEQIDGVEGLSWIRALFIGLLFALACAIAMRQSTSAGAAVVMTALAFAGGMSTIDLRPASIAAIFVVLAIAAARANNLVLFSLLTVLWINVHPSALLAPIIALLVTRRLEMPLFSAIALFINPYSYRGVIAPLELFAFARSGAFVNREWLPSDPRVFPLFFASLLIAAVAFLTARDRRSHTWRILLAILLAWLAVRHVRNQPLWFAAFPILVAPAIERVSRFIAYAASIVLVGWVAVRADHQLGVSRSRFPLDAVALLKMTQLRGNIYNPDQFGGLIIWTFYPERRALTDGRNELYHSFIPEYARARRDSRAWRAMLTKYRIDLAVDEYRAPLDVIDARSQRTHKVPASLAYWPRREWALIAFDRAGMVFARRAAFPPQAIEQWEIRGVVPDAGR